MTTPLEEAPFRLPSSPAEPELVAMYFRALGHPVRLGILEELGRRGECSVGELVELAGLAQPKISRHLACLRWCGFVSTRREHRTVHYRLADERVAGMIELARDLLRDNAEHLAACSQIDGGWQ
jgi:ArsR family transcriptional regulator, cadmium/lead-responsive transcriptional repressor